MIRVILILQIIGLLMLWLITSMLLLPCALIVSVLRGVIWVLVRIRDGRAA